MEKLLLTISILISNRPDTVVKCLNSLNALREAVPSELILVDTGCGEQVRRIIEKYTDKITDFKWCNDFAKARNAGIERAQGEWLLYMDDDEWFDDTKALEAFFLSDAYKEYNAAYYTVRNYLDRTGKTYVDAFVQRMIRRTPDTKFVYAIHECFEKVRGPIAKIDSYVHHYGYAYATEKEKYLHSQRNIRLLLKECEKNKNIVRNDVQLAQEYVATKEYEKSIEVSFRAIEKCKVNVEQQVWMSSLQANIVRCYYRICNYQQALDYGKIYLCDLKLNELGKAAINSVLCKNAFELHLYEESLKYIQEYLQAYDKQCQNKDYFIRYANMFLECFENQEVYSDIGFGIRSAIALRDNKRAKKLFDRIDFNAKVVFVDYETVVSIVKAYLKYPIDDDYLEMLNVLLSNERLIKTVVDIIEKNRKETPELFYDTKRKWEKIRVNHWYFKYLNVWTAQKLQQRDKYNELWYNPEYALSKSIELQLWDLAEKNSINIGKVLENIPFYKWKNAAENVCKKADWNDIQVIHTQINNMKQNNENALWWNLCYLRRSFFEMDVRKELDEVNIQEIRNFLKKYVAAGDALFRKIFQEELFVQKSEVLPMECQIMILLSDLFKQEEKNDFSSMVKNLKKIQEVCSDFAPPVKYYLIYTEEMIDSQRVEQKKAANELQTMTYIMKGKIEELIGMGRYQEAYSITQQVRQLVPDNLEIKELEKMLKVSLKVELAD